MEHYPILLGQILSSPYQAIFNENVTRTANVLLEWTTSYDCIEHIFSVNGTWAAVFCFSSIACVTGPPPLEREVYTVTFARSWSAKESACLSRNGIRLRTEYSCDTIDGRYQYHESQFCYLAVRRQMLGWQPGVLSILIMVELG